MDKHEEARKSFERDYAYAEENRDLANEDMRFVVVPGGQWEGFLEDTYVNKPKMEYDMVVQAVDRFMGEWAANELMPKFRDEDSDDQDDAELIDGIFRQMWRKEGGRMAAKNAVFEAAACGFGAVRMGTRYVDDYGVDDDRQDPTFTAIHGAHASVVFDANAQTITKQDAGHASVIIEYSREKFEELWPDVEPESLTQKDDSRGFHWVTKDSIFVVERYEKREKKSRIYLYMNQQGERQEIFDSELEYFKPELEMGGFYEVKNRKVKRREIFKSVLIGSRYLEEPRKISGKIIPLIPIYAFWAYIDGKEHYYGIVRKQKDPQRILNLQLSKLAEQAAESAREVPIFAPEQVKGLQTRWAEMRLGNQNFALARPLLDKMGNIISSGPLGSLKPPAIDPATQGLIEFTTQHIRTTSGGMPQDVEDPDASGKAILAVQKRIDMHTYTIMDNIANGMVRIGECFISIAQEIFTEDNRRVTILQEDGTEEIRRLNSYENKGGKIAKVNSIGSKRFEVYASVGPSFESQRRETIEFMKEIMAVLPPEHPLYSAVLSTVIDAMQGVGLGIVKDFNRKQMLLNGLVEPANEEEQKMVMEAQQANQQPQSMEELIQSQAALNFAEAQGQQAQNVKDLASAEKYKAEAAKIIEDIGTDKTRLLIDALSKMQPRQAAN